MQSTIKLREQIENGGMDEVFAWLYPQADTESCKDRYIKAIAAFEALYGENRSAVIISAPGRTEVCGNHTDHQHGRVLAAAVNLDIICVASPNSQNCIRIKSEGYDEDIVELSDLSVVEEEKNRAVSIIRGVAAWFNQQGYSIGGFDAYTTSDVLSGSGLSSSAAFEVAIGSMLSHLFNQGKISAADIAIAGQYAENQYFGKPSGLMDQMASAVGGFVKIDFADPKNPIVEPVSFDFAHSGYHLCIVDTKGSHADLTPDYAAIPQEMGKVAALFGEEYLRNVDEAAFMERLASVRIHAGDRAVLRALHYFADDRRVTQQVESLKRGDFLEFLRLVQESGQSSQNCLQNVFSCAQPQEQGLSLALALSKKLLGEDGGVCRVHGGGFAGTIQAFVRSDLLEDYRQSMEAVFGTGACYVLSIRPVGGIAVEC